MPKKKHSVEQIIHKLREAEVLLSQGKAVTEVCRSLGITAQTPTIASQLFNCPPLPNPPPPHELAGVGCFAGFQKPLYADLRNYLILQPARGVF